MEERFIHEPTGSTLHIEDTVWGKTFTLKCNDSKPKIDAMMYLMIEAFKFGIEVGAKGVKNV